MEYEIIDVHLHLCKDTATEKVVYPRPGLPDSWRSGSPETLPKFMDFWGVSKVVSLNAMQHRRRVQDRLARLPRGTSEAVYQSEKVRIQQEMVDSFRRFNDWACDVSRSNPRIQVYVGIDPILFGENTMAYFEDWVRKGTPGIKIHPGHIGATPDHPTLMAIYQRCQELRLPVFFDSGTSGGRGPGEVAYGEPIHFIPVLSTFPRLKLLMAHFCSAYWDERVKLAARFKDNLFFDISGALYEPPDKTNARDGSRALSQEEAVRVFREVGVERLMFGSEGQGQRLIADAEQIMRLDLTDAEKRLIFSENAKRIMGL